MIALRAGKHVASAAGRQSSLAVPMRSVLAVPGEATCQRAVTAGQRGFASKGSKGQGDPSKTKPTTAAPSAAPIGSPSAKSAPLQATPPPGTPAAGGAGTPVEEVSPETRGKNVVVGIALVGFVVGTYYYTINKMKNQDYLGDVEKEAEEEAMVHLHKSGLKVSSKIVPDSAGAESANASSTEGAGDTAVAELEVAGVQDVSEIAEAVLEMGGDMETAAAAAAAAEAAASPEVKKKKGWRKYWLFGPRVGGE